MGSIGEPTCQVPSRPAGKAAPRYVFQITRPLNGKRLGVRAVISSNIFRHLHCISTLFLPSFHRQPFPSIPFVLVETATMNERAWMATTRYRNGSDMGRPNAYQERDEFDNPAIVVASRLHPGGKERFLRTQGHTVRPPRDTLGGSSLPPSRTLPVESRTSPSTSFDRRSGPDEESHLTEVPFDMTDDDDDVTGRPGRTPPSTSGSIAAAQQRRLQPLIALPQVSGYEYSIKGPRYSSPSPVRIPYRSPSTGSTGYEDGRRDRSEGYSGPIEEEEEEKQRRRSWEEEDTNHSRSRRMDLSSSHHRRAHYTQRGYNQWEKVDTALAVPPSEYTARGRRRESPLMDEQDPFHGLDVDNVGGGDEDDNYDNDDIPQPLPVPLPTIRPRGTMMPLTDETSTEDDGISKRRSRTNLQERSQQAWKSRQRKNSFPKKPPVDNRGGASGEMREPVKERALHKVSFGGKNDVQYYDPPVSEVTDQSFEDEKSLNSEYTKTVESELEDMIKDVLFIGNPNTSRPGRRKYKFKHEVKKRLREMDEMGTTASSRSEPLETLDELDEDTVEGSRSRDVKASMPPTSQSSESSSRKEAVITKQSKNTRQNRTSSKSARNPNELDGLSEAEATLWNFVEGGMTVVSTALGLLPTIASDPTSQQGRDGYQVGDDFCAEPLLPLGDCSGGGRARPVVGGRKRTGTMSDVVENAQKMVDAQLMESVSVNWSGLMDFFVMPHIDTISPTPSRRNCRYRKIPATITLVHMIRPGDLPERCIFETSIDCPRDLWMDRHRREGDHFHWRGLPRTLASINFVCLLQSLFIRRKESSLMKTTISPLTRISKSVWWN
jgi:hypothetical protein